MKAAEQYCPSVLFTLLYTVVLTFESVADEILISNEIEAMPSRGTFFYSLDDTDVQGYGLSLSVLVVLMSTRKANFST